MSKVDSPYFIKASTIILMHKLKIMKINLIEKIQDPCYHKIRNFETHIILTLNNKLYESNYLKRTDGSWKIHCWSYTGNSLYWWRLVSWYSSLTCSKATLTDRWQNDKVCPWRTSEWLKISTDSLLYFSTLDNTLDTSNLSIKEVAEKIMTIN